MSLHDKVFESIISATEQGSTLAASIAAQIKDLTLQETWYCTQARTINARKDGKLCAASVGLDVDRHEYKRTGCGMVAIVRI